MNRADQTFRLGLQLLGQNRVQAALDAFEQAARLAPQAAAAHHMIGIALQRLGKLDHADKAISRAIKIDGRQADYHANRSVVRCGQQNFDAAVADAKAALALAPRHLGALCNLGLAYLGAERYVAAVDAFVNAVRIAPDFLPAQENLGRAIHGLDNIDTALVAVRRFLAVTPDSAVAHGVAGTVYGLAGDARASSEAFGHLVDRQSDNLAAIQALMFQLNYVEESHEELRAATARRLAKALANPRAVTHRPVATDVERPLRLGFVSGDFRQHSVSQFLLSLLPELRQRGLILCAYQISQKTDSTTKQLKESFELWRDISSATDEAAAATVQRDRIDILFDLSGLTSGNRQPLFSFRPAPVAISWLGYSASTCNPAIDYILCKNFVLPAELEPWFSEQPLRMPGPYLCFAPSPVPMPEHASGDRFAFGSFNTLNKMSERTVALWSRILTAAPASKLILKTAALSSQHTREQTQQRFARNGIDPERLVLIGRTPTREDHLALYGRLGLALDPWPYSGTTTTMEALSMGVPVLTLNEGPFISRVSGSLLSAAGLDHWISATEDDYVRKAVAAANDPGLAATRTAVRQSVLSSPVCDPVSFSRDFETTVRGAWRKWCASEPRPAPADEPAPART